MDADAIAVKPTTNVPQETLDYFRGDELQARVFYDKYALRTPEGEVVERTPQQMWRRIARELASVEDEFGRLLTVVLDRTAARFFEVTSGHVIIAGPTTIASIPPFAYEDRTICEIRSANHPAEVLAWFPDRVIYVGGGPPVWATYAPFIRHWDITRLPYDGEADRWFDPAWLVASEKPG